MDTKINDLPFFDKKIPCPECHHEILSSNLHRHLNRDCRRRFLTECEYCGSMMSSHRLMEHQLGRNKKGGCKSKYEGISMEERKKDPLKKSIEDTKAACKTCGKVVLKRSMNRHIKSHKGFTTMDTILLNKSLVPTMWYRLIFIT